MKNVVRITSNRLNQSCRTIATVFKPSVFWKWSAVLSLMASAVLPVHAQQTYKFVVFDGGKYQGEQLRWASSNPTIGKGVTLQKEGWIAIPKSADGHYHIAATVNGFPVTFLVDTGATQTFVGQDIARNAGIKAGMTEKVQTANGPMEVAATEGNQMVIGPYPLSDVRISVGLSQKGVSTPLLGMDVLKRFRIVQEQNTLLLQPVPAKK